MFKLSDLLNILKFQIYREIMNLGKMSLELLEAEKNKRLKLEKLLEQAGFEDRELFGAEKDFKINRKKILDEFNSKSNQVLEFIKKFDIQNKEK